MEMITEESKAYESIIQNLLTLKKEAVMTRPGEVKSIEAILQSLFNLSDGLQLPTLGIHQAEGTSKAQDNEHGKVLVHAH